MDEDIDIFPRKTSLFFPVDCFTSLLIVLARPLFVRLKELTLYYFSLLLPFQRMDEWICYAFGDEFMA